MDQITNYYYFIGYEHFSSINWYRGTSGQKYLLMRGGKESNRDRRDLG